MTRLAVQRLISQIGLVMCLVLGIAIAVMLVSAIPAFSDAVQLNIMQNRLDDSEQGVRRSPFTFQVSFVGLSGDAIEYEDYLGQNDYVLQRIESVLQMPVTRTVRYVRTSRLPLYLLPTPTATADQSAAANGPSQQVGTVGLGYITGIERHIALFGQLPQLRNDDVIEVLAYSEFADETGLQPGEDFAVYAPSANGAAQTPLKLRVTGIWSPKDPNSDYWFYRPESLKYVFILNEDQYAKQVAPVLKRDTEFYLWHFIADGSGFDPAFATGLIDRLSNFYGELERVRAGLELRQSITGPLKQFVKATNDLTLLLVIFSIPLLTIVFYFVVLIAGMVVRQQEGEIAMLRSRGASPWSIALLYVIQGVIVGAIALPLGLLGGLGLASLMTRLTSFLSVLNTPALPVHLTVQAFRFGVAMVIIGMLAALVPAIAAARRTIVSYRLSQARSNRPPLWQRAYLDVILLAVSAYIYYQMRLSGGLLPTKVLPSLGDPNQPFADPLRFLTPVFMLSALALLLTRLIPWLMRLLAWAAARLPISVSILMALRSLARTPAQYSGPLLLLMFTVALAVFSSSVAHTLDTYLIDSTYFQVGADVRLVETADRSQQTMQFNSLGQPLDASRPVEVAEQSEQTEAVFYSIPPVENHLKIPGVRSATRIGRYPASPNVLRAPSKSMFVGVDRAGYPQTGYFRRDFAAQPLGALMNALALDRSAMLVSPEFLANNQLRLGDKVAIDVGTNIGTVPMTLTIAGAYALFPTDDPRVTQKPEIFIGNLDHLFESAGTELPYDVLLTTKPGTRLDEIVDTAGNLGYYVVGGKDARQIILDEQLKPERQGLFGLLSAGFITASLLTITGFVLSAIISFRARAIQLGVLRTVGLSAAQMGTFVLLEQMILIGLGTMAGTGLGLLVSYLFIPFMQVGGSIVGNVLPFAIQIAWDDVMVIYAALGVTLFAALGIMLWLLSRLKAFEAVKLGVV